MDFIRRLVARLRNRRFDSDLAEELQFHEEMKRRELEAQGVAADESAARAKKALGNVTLMREESRGVWIAPWAESVAQDVRYAVRSLLRQPTYSLTAGLVLVFAIGLNTSLFSVFKAIVLAPWPVKDPDSVVVVRVFARETGRVGPPLTAAEAAFVRTNVRSLSGLVVHSFPGNRTFLGDSVRDGASLPIVWASANVFDVLGVRMQLGGGFVQDDDRPGHARAAVVLSDRAWHIHFAADPAIVGRSIRIAARPFTVVGVAEPGFDGLGREVDLWMPLSAMASMKQEQSTGMTGRLADGVDVRAAREELQLLHDRFAASQGRPPGRIDVVRTTALVVNRNGMALMGLMAAAVLLVLVLACSNVGNLQLARSLARRREIATRLSIGASRARVIRQLLTEGFVLAGLAAALAIGVAALLPEALLRLAGEDVPAYLQRRLAPDAQVLAFSLIVATLACLFFALAPAFRATRGTIPMGAIDRGSTRATRLPLRTVFLATQVAVCTVLLFAAGLLTRAVNHAMSFDPGFAVEGVHIAALSLPSEDYNRAQQSAFVRQVYDELERDYPGGIAIASPTPLQIRLGMTIRVPHEKEDRFVMTTAVSPSYFDVLRITVLQGLVFDRKSTTEAVVNEAAAAELWPGRNPLGQVVNDVERDGTVRRTLTVVGVVRNAYLTRLDEIEPMIFTPATTGQLIARGDAETVGRIRTTALGINPAATVRTFPVTDNFRKRLEESQMGANLAWGIGLLGLTLAAVGVFGVFAYAAEERRREIGLRLALGATRSQIVRMLVGTSGRAIMFGLGAGVLGSFASGPVLGQYLYGLNPLDPQAYGLVGVLLIVAGAVATLVPARRALGVDPAVTLREE